MSIQPTVSAVITTHNRSHLLSRAIESVLTQTYKSLECIVVDDASSDNTREVCAGYDVIYIYIPKEESKGGNHARNLGVKASNGKYVAFLDDDDFWLPTKIEKQVSLIEEKKVELVSCGRRFEIIKNGKVKFDDQTLYFPDGDMRKKILYAICTTTSCMMVLKKAIVDIGYYDEDLKFWQEYELTIRLAQRLPFYFVNEPLCVYRVDLGDKQRLTNKFYEWQKAVRYVYDKHRMLYNKLSFIDKCKVKNLYLDDALMRSKASHLWGRYWLYYLLLIPRNLIRKIR